MKIARDMKACDAGRQRGFSLFEVLVAVVVLALGLLGLAALQLTSLQGGHGAYTRAQAAQLAYDMGDRIRANPGNIGSYDFAMGAAPACDEALAPAGDLAARDVAEWLNSLACLLPGGNGSVDVNAAGEPMIVDIRVEWIDRQGAQDGVTDGAFDFRVEL